MPAPCTGNRIYTAPAEYGPEERNDAIKQCWSCPLREQCAKAAIDAGSTLDLNYRGPAIDVIQGGVWLRPADSAASLLLHAIAGVKPRPQRRRAPTPTVCARCDRAMIARDRKQPTRPDVPTHAARGYCRACYQHLRRTGQLDDVKRKHSTIFGWAEKHTKAA